MSGIPLNNASLLYISIVGISLYVAPILSLIICVPVNFIMNRYLGIQMSACRYREPTINYCN